MRTRNHRRDQESRKEAARAPEGLFAPQGWGRRGWGGGKDGKWGNKQSGSTVIADKEQGRPCINLVPQVVDARGSPVVSETRTQVREQTLAFPP